MEASNSLQIISTVLSIVICIAIIIKYFKYKKNLEVLYGLEDLKCKNELTLDDKNYIERNEEEYKIKSINVENRLKFLNPLFILIVGLIFAFTTFSNAMIYLNIVVVAYLYFILDRNHKKTTYDFLSQLKKDGF